MADLFICRRCRQTFERHNARGRAPKFCRTCKPAPIPRKPKVDPVTQDQTQASNFVADLAERYAALVISKWAARGLPVAALAAELLVSGLRETTRHERPGNVAESLERMADAIRDGSQGWRETVN